MPTIKSFLVQYKTINESNTFTSGDCVTGQVILDLEKGCEITSMSVKLKGKAKTKWKEKTGGTTITYQDEEKYFSTEHLIIESDSVVEMGYHTYPFTFTIPQQELPSSFMSKYGKIEYKLEAVLSRVLKFNTKAQAFLTIIHRDPGVLPLATPQSGTVEKKMRLFASGTVSMEVKIDRSSLRPGGSNIVLFNNVDFVAVYDAGKCVYNLLTTLKAVSAERTDFIGGEVITAVASVFNKASRQVRLKYCLLNKITYFDCKHKAQENKVIVKEVGETIPPSSNPTITKLITIPPTTSPSILNCRIIKSEYKLKVYLDIKYASDPEVKLPIVILPHSEEPGDDFKTFNMAGGSFPQNPSSHDLFGSYHAVDDTQRKS